MNSRLLQIKQLQSKIQRSRNVCSYQLPPLSPKCSSDNSSTLLLEARKRQEHDQLNNTSKHKLIDIITENSAENSLEMTQTDLKHDCGSKTFCIFSDQYQHLDLNFL
ncbi:Hypothetical_protein [Hexamita inflata]|uniref:Hypothetical_protein n=1 Tax=Hexamita inflata TaxID=28002 RepID=A0AA86QIJ0_9EUKA|nr:Hypothetical protein HINF_LOCUS40000 [Hexamita inflata]